MRNQRSMFPYSYLNRSFQKIYCTGSRDKLLPHGDRATHRKETSAFSYDTSIYQIKLELKVVMDTVISYQGSKSLRQLNGNHPVVKIHPGYICTINKYYKIYIFFFFLENECSILRRVRLENSMTKVY